MQKNYKSVLFTELNAADNVSRQRFPNHNQQNPPTKTIFYGDHRFNIWLGPEGQLEDVRLLPVNYRPTLRYRLSRRYRDEYIEIQGYRFVVYTDSRGKMMGADVRASQ